MTRNAPEPTHFLNVDLDLYSNANLQPLVTAMTEQLMILCFSPSLRTGFRVQKVSIQQEEIDDDHAAPDPQCRVFCQQPQLHDCARQAEADHPRIKAHANAAKRLDRYMPYYKRAERHADKH